MDNFCLRWGFLTLRDAASREVALLVALAARNRIEIAGSGGLSGFNKFGALPS